MSETERNEGARSVSEYCRMPAEELFSLFFENIGDAAFVVEDGTRRIVACNRAAETIFGYRCEELLEQTTERLHVDAEHHARFGRLSKELLDANETFRCEFQMRRRDGAVFPTANTVTWVRVGPDERYALSLVRDLSAVRARHRELRDKHDRLAQVGTTLAFEELAATLVHELRTPLAAARNFHGALARRIDPGEDGDGVRATLLARIAAQLDRIDAIAENMVEMFRGTRLAVRQTPVRRLIDEVLEMMDQRLHDAGVRVESDLEPGLPDARIDPLQVEQVLVNCLRNSVDALRGVPLEQCRVRITARREDARQLRISVADTGEETGGLEAAQQALLKSFRTAQNVSEGFGLGLTVCRRIVQAHGGKIWIERNTPSGLIVHFTLPSAETPADAP